MRKKFSFCFKILIINYLKFIEFDFYFKNNISVNMYLKFIIIFFQFIFNSFYDINKW